MPFEDDIETAYCYAPKIAEDDPRHVQFDGGWFRFRGELPAERDTMRIFDEDLVMGETDRPVVRTGRNPFCPSPYRVWVFEPDSVTVHVHTVKGDPVGDCGPFLPSPGHYALWFGWLDRESGLLLAEIVWGARPSGVW